MAFEVAETGGATSVDVPTLADIENDEQDRAQERLKEFSDYALDAIREYKQALDQGAGATAYQQIQRVVAEIGSAMMRARQEKNIDLEINLIQLQGKLAKNYTEELPESINPIASRIGVHELGDNINKDTRLESSDKERLMQALIREAENNDINIMQPLDLNKEAFITIGQQIKDPEVAKVYQQRIDKADNVVILKKEEEKDEGSFLWRGVKWVGKKLLGLAGSILGRVALYTALGGAGAYLLHRYAPGVPRVIRGIMSVVAPKFTENLIQGATDVGSFLLRNFNKVKDFFTNLF